MMETLCFCSRFTQKCCLLWFISLEKKDSTQLGFILFVTLIISFSFSCYFIKLTAKFCDMLPP